MYNHPCNILQDRYDEDLYYQKFSYKFLKELRDDKRDVLVSAPTTGLLRKPMDEVKGPDLMCFPGAVIEFRHSEVQTESEEVCYCKAANAAAAALSIYESLFTSAGQSIDKVPPVVTFTCIGSDLRVWLAYLDTVLGKVTRVSSNLDS